jgi:hypothetical protein
MRLGVLDPKSFTVVMARRGVTVAWGKLNNFLGFDDARAEPLGIKRRNAKVPGHTLSSAADRPLDLHEHFSFSNTFTHR